MPQDTSKHLPSYRSTLEDHPAHVRAIGMISIEMFNLDYMLGGLLGALLHISPDIARVVYLTPRAAFGRLEIIKNVSKESVNPGSEIHTAVERILKRTKSILSRRHNMIHDSWGTTNGKPSRIKIPPTDKSSTPMFVSLNELEDMINEIREISTSVYDLSDSLYSSWPPYASLDKSGLPNLDDQS
jgi:hypothetical protein